MAYYYPTVSICHFTLDQQPNLTIGGHIYSPWLQKWLDNKDIARHWPALVGPRRRHCPKDAVTYRGQNVVIGCYCTPQSTESGAVWGSGTYTDDSKICRAAVHAGRISTRGGDVRFAIRGGLNSYYGSLRNGVKTRDYKRSWKGSFVFN